MKINLNKNFTIDFNQPLHEFDSNSAKAFKVTNSDDLNSGVRYYGLVCDPKLPPRLSDIAKLQNVSIPSLQTCLGYFIIRQQIFVNSQAPVLVFSIPKDYQLITSNLNDSFDPIDSTKITEKFLVPILDVLKVLQDIGMTHRAIQVNNIFINLKDNNSKVILGQCFTDPPGSQQSHIYELVRYAQANRYGRGYGSWKNDVFALGVSLLAVIIGVSPLPNTAISEIIYHRFEGTTYNLYLGQSKVPERWMLLLRGMINEDSDLILDLEQINDILYRQKSFTRAYSKRKNTNAIDFKGKEHRTLSSFSNSVYENWHEARGVLSSNRVINWLNRSINVSGMHNIQSSLARLQDKKVPISNLDRLLATCLIYLDPNAPIRFKNISARPSALAIIGGLFYDDLAYKENFDKVFKYNLSSLWSQININATSRYRHLDIENLNKSFRAAANDSAKQAVFYEFYKDLPLKSKLFEGYFVHNIKAMLLALEEIISTRQLNHREPILNLDSYAYIKVQCNKEKLFLPWKNLRNLPIFEILSEEIKILASLQNQVEVIDLEQICEFARKRLIYLADQIKIKSHSKRLIKDLSSVKHKGNLATLLEVWNNGEKLSKDISEYNSAKKNYVAQLITEFHLDKSRSNKLRNAKNNGQSVAIGSSNILSVIGLIFFLLYLI